LIFHLLSAKGPVSPTREKYLGGRIQVISRSGLNPSEAGLIRFLPKMNWKFKAGNDRLVPRILTVGNRTGVVGQAAAHHFESEATLHTFDIHHHRMMKKNILPALAKKVTPICQADLPEEETYDLAFFQLNRGNMSTELVADMTQQAALRLRPGGQLVFCIQGSPQWLTKKLKNIFKNVQIYDVRRGFTILHATSIKQKWKTRNFKAEFQASLPDVSPFPMVTYPGVFAHRRPDEGGLALAEIADIEDGDRILDMGCGCGLIGISLCKLGTADQLTLIDSHARATKATKENIALSGIETPTQVLLSDGDPEDTDGLAGKYDLFVGNPPYYSQNQVTQRFVELSHQVLVDGGRALFVTKQPEWLSEELAKLFGEVQVFPRRTYQILRAIKS